MIALLSSLTTVSRTISNLKLSTFWIKEVFYCLYQTLTVYSTLGQEEPTSYTIQFMRSCNHYQSQKWEWDKVSLSKKGAY